MGANFRSDNVAGIDPAILDAVARANSGPANAYGGDDCTKGLNAKFGALFETEVSVLPVALGTAANALSLSAVTPPWGAIYAHEKAHIIMDECNAPELYSGGARLIGLPGEHGKIEVETLATTLKQALRGVHHAKPSAVSLTQLTESGTAYSVDEVKAIGALCRKEGLALHMDGSRLGNAIAGLGCTPAEITWKAGVDLLSFGATKNGAMAAEAVVLFRRDPSLLEALEYRRKRAGHLFSKMRFLSVQLEAYIEGGRWLRNARHANGEAQRLAKGLGAIPGVELLSPVQGNEIFARMPVALVEAIEGEGYLLQPWENPEGGRQVMRLVTAFNTDPKAVDGLLAVAGKRRAA